LPGGGIVARNIKARNAVVIAILPERIESRKLSRIEVHRKYFASVSFLIFIKD
jgi:hypothetical protein